MVSRIRMAFKFLCLIAIVYLGYFLFIELFYPWRHYESISAYRFKLYGDFKMSGDRIAFDEVDPTALIGSAHSTSVDMPRHSSQLFTGIHSNQSSDYFKITQFSSLPEHISGAGFSPPLFERTLSWFPIRTHGCVYLHQHKSSSKKALLARVLDAILPVMMGPISPHLTGVSNWVARYSNLNQSCSTGDDMSRTIGPCKFHWRGRSDWGFLVAKQIGVHQTVLQFPTSLMGPEAQSKVRLFMSGV